MKNLIPAVLSAALSLALALPATASPLGGSQTGNDVLPGRTVDTYYVTLLGGERTDITVRGDGDTDLDLYVYNEAGDLIVSDTDSSDKMAVWVVPGRTQTFRIEIVNLGYMSNAYDIEAW